MITTTTKFYFVTKIIVKMSKKYTHSKHRKITVIPHRVSCFTVLRMKGLNLRLESREGIFYVFESKRQPTKKILLNLKSIILIYQMQFAFRNKLFKRWVFEFAQDRIPIFSPENLIERCKPNVENVEKNNNYCAQMFEWSDDERKLCE